MVEITFNGENIPLTQHHIVDVGFVAFHVAPLGGDKMILHCSRTNEVLSVFHDDVDFLANYFIILVMVSEEYKI